MRHLFLMMLLLLAISLGAQAVDTVVLKDGDTISGIVLEHVPGEYVRISTQNGRQKVIAWDQIASIDLQSDAQIAPKAKTEVKRTVNAGVALTYTKDLPEDKLRLFWLSQGGSRTYSDNNFYAIALKMKPSSDGTEMKMDGEGLGYNGTVAWLYFDPPDAGRKKIYAYAIKAGVGMGVDFFRFQNEIDISESGFEMNMKSTMLTTTLNMGVVLGINAGLGYFPLNQKWIGATAGIAWKPNFRYSNTLTTTKTTSNSPYVPNGTSTDSAQSSTFETGSIEYNIDFGSVKALTDKFAPRSTLRISLIIVPPHGDNKLSMVMFGLGMGTYK